MATKAEPKDQVAFTVQSQRESLTIAYRSAELSFLGNEVCVELSTFCKAIGLWDNFRVATGMNTEAWAEKDGATLEATTTALLARLEADWDLFGHDYSYRCPHQMNRQRGIEGVILKDGRRGLLVSQRPGELHISLRTDGHEECIDLRGLASFEAESPPFIRFYRKPNNIRWREHLRTLSSFLLRLQAPCYRVRHFTADERG